MGKKELIRSLKEQNFPTEIVEAFVKVDREKYIPKEFLFESYEDIPIPIGHEQTTSQPFTIAYMLTLLEVKDGQKILEIGSGSGYVIDLLTELAPNGKIFGIERVKELAEKSAFILQGKNVKIIYADGFNGLKIEAPFDRILVSAEMRDLPSNLFDQLELKGILVVPVNDSIVVVKKEKRVNKIIEYHGFSFVPFQRGTE